MSSIASTLIDILNYRGKYQTDKLAYVFLQNGETESESLTYGELEKKAKTIATHLQSFHGERALLLYSSGLDFIIAFFGCLYAGVVAIPLYPPRRNQKLSRLLSIVKDAEAKIALTTSSISLDLEKRWEDEAGLFHLELIATDNIETDEEEYVTESVLPESLAFLQYTSGSTGTPKGVMVTHENIIHNQQLIGRAFGHDEQTIVAGWLPLFHDMGLIGNVLQPMYLGIPCILMPPVAFLMKPIRWLQAISKYKATTSGGPNFAYDLCVKKVKPEQLTNLDLSSWDLAYSGAEPVQAETLKQFAEKFAGCGFDYSAFYPCYGMAETTLFVTGGEKKQKPVIQGVKAKELEQNLVVESNISERESRNFVGCGRAERNTKVLIVDPKSLTRCQKERVGEIWVSSKSVAAGYWNRPQATKETFQGYLKDTGDGPFLRTGDLGFFRNEELFITGRMKDVIIIRGSNYYPQDIELTVENTHPSLRKHCSAAFSVSIEGEERLIVVCEVERTYLRKLNIDEIVREIQIAVATEHELEVYGIALLKTGSIPKTSSGKIKRRGCKQEFLANSLNVVEQWSKNGLSSKIDSYKRKLRHYQNFNSAKTIDRNSLSGARSKTVAEIEAWLTNKIAELLHLIPEKIDLKQPLAIYGLDSVKAVSIAAELEEWLGITVPPTIVYDYPSINSLANYFGQESSGLKSFASVAKPDVVTEPIAIIGTGCRLPKADNPQAFWSLLRSGDCATTEIPISRRGSDYSWGGFLERVDRFDAQFFNISPREANNMDPQQRLLLEISWEALENAGLAADCLAGIDGGVFVGISNGDYAKLNGNLNNIEAYYGTGNALSIAANRLSYFLDWHGPSLAIDTACSSSLVAVHQACQSLRQRECHLALAGGVNLMLSPQLTLTFSEARMMATDGRCKTFDAEADGYVRSEGCGVVILKRLTDALADGDYVRAVIRGSAVNQDGLTNGLTAPNGKSQQEVIRLALAKAGVEPNQISYVETHGTGTSLGDPIEVNSLKAVLMEGRKSDRPCWIGSVKTNIGHTEAAAGITGLIKLVLSLKHGKIPPSLHLKQLNPHIKLEKTPIKICTQLQPWSSVGQPRLAGISAFGFGGTNAHLIVEEAPTQNQIKDRYFKDRPWHLLTLSAKSEPALLQLADNYAQFLSHNTASIADICFTANTGRSHFTHRLAIVTSSRQELADKLAKIADKERVSGVFSEKLTARNKAPQIACLFTGQGSQYINMGRELYETQPVFRQNLERCDQILRPYIDKSLLDILYPRTGDTTNIDETAYAQPALFAIEYALYQLWKSWGIEADIVMGHSVGEYVAATVAGVFSLEDGLKLIASRANLMQALPQNGEMLAILADEATVGAAMETVLENQSEASLAIAAINGQKNMVISGERQAVRAVQDILKDWKIETRKLKVSHAFHSPLMKPMLEDFARVLSRVTYSLPQIDLIANVTGKLATKEIATPEYWLNHILGTVRFAEGISTLQTSGCEIFLEIGAKPILLAMGRKCLPEKTKTWLPSLNPRQGDWQQMLTSLGQLYTQGVAVNWLQFDKDYRRQKTVLPTYPFQRQRYWIEEYLKQLEDIPSHTNQLNLDRITQILQDSGDFSLKQIELLLELLQTSDKKYQQDLDIISTTEKSIKLLPKQQTSSFSIKQQLETTPLQERQRLLVDYLKKHLNQVLGFNSSHKLQATQALNTLGIDSLMAMELRNRFVEELEVDITFEKFIEEITIEQLADLLLMKFALTKINAPVFDSNHSTDNIEEIIL